MIETLFTLALSLNNPQEIEKTRYIIEQLQPGLSYQESYERAVAINYYAQEHELPKYKWMAIMFQESSFWLDPTDCLESPDNCTQDYGIGQVNYRVWGKHLKISKYHALTDVVYSIKISALVLADYKRRYAKRYKDSWIYKYHSKTPYFKNLYEERIDAIYVRIKAYLEEYEDVKRLGIRNSRTNYCRYQDGQKKVPVEIFKSLVYNVR